MAALLNKFRINYADLVVITDLNKPPKESTKTWFDGLVRPFIRREELSGKCAVVLKFNFFPKMLFSIFIL
jgi:solute carrier family 12 sodium/potassium/chloride transporter 2